MLMNIGSLFVAAIVFLIVTAYMKGRKPVGLPPGPSGWPFIGNLLMIWNNDMLHKTVANLKEAYGSMYSLQFGWKSVVVISDPDKINELFTKRADNFSHRVTSLVLKLNKMTNGIGMTTGSLWKASRKMALTTLRDFGVGKSSIEVKVQEEAQAVVQKFAKTEGKPFRLDQTFAKATSNVICSVLFAKRYEYDDPEFETLMKCLDVFFEMGSQSDPYVMMPCLLPLIILQKRYATVYRLNGQLVKFVERHVQKHRETYQAGITRDFVDVYLETELGNDDKKLYNDENVFGTIIDLFLAGTETTSVTLKWAVLFMLKNPEVQQRCRQDILKIIGPDRTPNLSDREKLPYVEATICEAQRIGNITPHGVFHATNSTVELDGYVLPEQTLILPDIYSIHFDPTLWDQPKMFKPERFINEEGKVVRPKHFMPFSIGRRMCLGENLARTELFIFFTSLLQKYQFTVPNGSKLPDTDDAAFGFTLCPPPFDVIAKEV